MPRDLRAGVETHWTTFGHGPRRALAIHCTLAHAGSWAGLGARLAEQMTLIAFDLPGHGQTAPWEAGMGEVQGLSTAMALDFATDLAAEAQGEIATGTVDLLGHSFGATVALRLAVERPDLVRSLVLIEPVLFAVAFAGDPAARDRYEADMSGYVRAMAAGDTVTAAREFTAIWGDGRNWDSLPAAARAALARDIPMIDAAAPALMEDVAGVLAPGALERIACPVLLLGGSASPAITEAITEGLAARLPHAARAMIGGAGHMAPITHPRQVASELQRFFDEV
ncbi:alpha/beta fold hydrolase [Roseovarius sp.]|jgi:pimeloyl-ACP methyl ester carboxylesterase